ASRRLQLAAEGSGTIGIAIRRLPRIRERVMGARLTNGSRVDSLPCGGGQSHLATPHTSPRLREEIGICALVQIPGEGAFPQAQDSRKAPLTPTLSPQAGRGRSVADFGQPTAAVTRWRVSALPSAPLPVPGVGRARWRLELIRCRGGESAEFEVEACDAQGRLALPSDLVHGSGQKAIG